jgi:hypothetical protein
MREHLRQLGQMRIATMARIRPVVDNLGRDVRRPLSTMTRLQNSASDVVGHHPGPRCHGNVKLLAWRYVIELTQGSE